MIVRYNKGAENPDISLTWKDPSGNIIDFSTGYTFELKIGQGGYTASITKTTGITGAQTSPNVIIVFVVDELNTIPTGLYEAQLRARQVSTSKDRYMRFWFQLQPSVL